MNLLVTMFVRVEFVLDEADKVDAVDEFNACVELAIDPLVVIADDAAIVDGMVGFTVALVCSSDVDVALDRLTVVEVDAN